MTDRPPIVVWVRTRNAGTRKTYHTQSNVLEVETQIIKRPGETVKPTQRHTIRPGPLRVL